ncbi:MAG: cryptochrome/photolyase family protein [Pseudomonadota bacterium]
MANQSCDTLILILGDQLDATNPALVKARRHRDRVLMIECEQESTHVWTHKHRIALFLSAMRHYAQALRDDGWTVEYRDLTNGINDIAQGLADAIKALRPARVCVVQPGEWRLLEDMRVTCRAADIPLEVCEDCHFFVTNDEFASWARGRKQLTMEYFYREQRRRFDVLMDDGEPVGGEWNYDKENRASFGRKGPQGLPTPPAFAPDSTTQAVITTVNERFPNHPGCLDNFAWPVTREEALQALSAFVEQRLPLYGRYQDAMWQGEPFLFHALLASSMNLKLLNPREVIDAAVAAWQSKPDLYPLASVEGFVRQILGWREFIRGIYWQEMPGYKALNHFSHEHPLPEWFWSGNTDMNCLRQTIGDTIRNGYAHHIQRLMIIGNYATLAGLAPTQVCDWFLSVYVDAVEWVELPNTLGMALHGDGGIVGSKPYVASGAYIKRMSNYCNDCRYTTTQRSGEDACPFNALYWDFLHRHRDSLSRTPRMRMVLKNLDRWDRQEIEAIKKRAADHRGAS